MNINASFPSKYLKAADLPDGQTVNVVIDRIAIEDVAGNGDPEDKKPVMYFRGKEKGLVLNKTNANILSAVHGHETDDWIGQSIGIYSTETSFQGKQVPCIRVRIPKAKAAAPAAKPTKATPPPADDELEAAAPADDIPF